VPTAVVETVNTCVDEACFADGSHWHICRCADGNDVLTALSWAGREQLYADGPDCSQRYRIWPSAPCVFPVVTCAQHINFLQDVSLVCRLAGRLFLSRFRFRFRYFLGQYSYQYTGK
jgi:hypothetical protein